MITENLRMMTMRESLHETLTPVLEAHEHVCQLSFQSPGIFNGLLYRVSVDVAVLILAFHIRKASNQMNEQEFLAKLKCHASPNFLTDADKVKKILRGVDDSAIATSRWGAFESLRELLGDTLAVALVAITHYSRPNRKRDQLRFCSHLMRHLPHESLWVYVDENTGKLHAEKFTRGLTTLFRYPAMAR